MHRCLLLYFGKARLAHVPGPVLLLGLIRVTRESAGVLVLAIRLGALKFPICNKQYHGRGAAEVSRQLPNQSLPLPSERWRIVSLLPVNTATYTSGHVTDHQPKRAKGPHKCRQASPSSSKAPQ